MATVLSVDHISASMSLSVLSSTFTLNWFEGITPTFTRCLNFSFIVKLPLPPLQGSSLPSRAQPSPPPMEQRFGIHNPYETRPTASELPWPHHKWRGCDLRQIFRTQPSVRWLTRIPQTRQKKPRPVSMCFQSQSSTHISE